MAAASETSVKITGDASGAVAAIGRVRGEFASLQAISAKALAIGGALGVTAAVASLTAVTKHAIDAGDALSKMSAKTGESVENLSKLQYAADLSGVSSEELGKSMSKLASEIASAGSGSEKSAKLFASLGIPLRNADSSLRSTGDVLADLATHFQAMPDGVGKTALAVEIFGERLGARMIPLLNSGADGLKALGDELEALGAVMSTALAKESEAFNDNLSRLGKLSESTGIAVGNALIPSLNSLLGKFLDFKTRGATLADAVFGQNIADHFKTNVENIAIIEGRIAKLRQEMKSAKDGDAIDLDYAIARQERLLAVFRKQAQREGNGGKTDDELVADDAKLAAKRITLQASYQAKLAELEQLKGIAAGKVSADILLDDAKRTDAQIKNAEKLRDALRTAWQSSLDGAQKAGEEAKKLLESAAGTRQGAADKAGDIRRSALPQADQDFLNARDARISVNDAENAATLAKFAALQGRTENAAKLADEATKQAERAARLVERLGDPEDRALAVERLGEAQATADEARAKIKQQEAKGLQEQAAAQAATLRDLDTQLAELQAKAAALDVKVKIDEAQAAVAQITAALAAIPNRTVYVDVVTRNAGGAIAASNSSAEGFAAGGYTGRGGKFEPAGIVHRGEYVLPSEVVSQAGVLAYLRRLHAQGAAALPGFAAGGLVGRINPGSLSDAGGVRGASNSATFNIPGMGSYATTVDGYTFDRLQRDFARAALQKGGRR